MRPRAAKGECGIDYRDLLGQMLRKPGAFAGYRWRDAFFPQAVFRELFAALEDAGGDAAACDLEYLRILDRAVKYGENRVAEILRQLLRQGEVPSAVVLDEVLEAKPKTPDLRAFQADPAAYDNLLGAMKGGSRERAS